MDVGRVVDVNTDPFKHSPIQGVTWIRVLNLLPNAAFDSPIEVQLVEVDLAGKPEYEALSYSWGDVKNKVGISCHGLRLDVTINCALALQYLRHKDQTRTLWIDAICIDQTNMAERNQQVRIMGDVYEMAQRVLVWLGLRGSVSDLAITLLKDFEKAIGEDSAKQDALAKEWYGKSQDIKYLFSDLSKRPWFYRLWTLQEAAVAREVMVIFGEWNISWDVLKLAMSRLRLLENAAGRFDMISTFDNILGGRQVIVNALSLRSRKELPGAPSSNEDHPVSTVFTRGLFYQAQVRKDHVFGVYALLQKLGAQLPEPDYRRPVDQIFAEAARLAIESDNKLWILCFVNGLEERENWPSWVPTWLEEKFGPPALDERFFKAAAGSLPLYTFSDDGRRLTVKGKKVDLVSRKAQRSPLLGDPLWNYHTGADAIESAINVIKAYHEWMIIMHMSSMYSSFMPSRYGDMHDQTMAFIRVLLQDFTAVPGSLDRYEEIIMGFKRWQQLLSATNPGSSMPMAAIEAMLEPEDMTSEELPESKRYLRHTPEWKIFAAIFRDPKASLFDHHTTLGCKCKVFFTTQSGYFGMAPASIQQGDAIVLISGLQTPLVVRPVDDGGNEYRLLGPAFVLGLMEGELWPLVERDLSDLTFV